MRPWNVLSGAQGALGLRLRSPQNRELSRTSQSRSIIPRFKEFKVKGFRVWSLGHGILLIIILIITQAVCLRLDFGGTYLALTSSDIHASLPRLGPSDPESLP